jgi:hypothetical protein
MIVPHAHPSVKDTSRRPRSRVTRCTPTELRCIAADDALINDLAGHAQVDPLAALLLAWRVDCSR